MMVAASCSRPVSNSFNPVVYECGGLDLAPGQGAIKLAAPSTIDPNASPFDVFTVNGRPEKLQLSQKLCLPLEAGKRQLVGIGSNKLNVYYYDYIEITAGNVAHVSLRPLEAPQFSMACPTEVAAKELPPLRLGDGWNLPTGFDANFSLKSEQPEQAEKPQAERGFFIADNSVLYLRTDPTVTVPEGKYVLTGSVTHPVLNRQFEIAGIADCKLTIDRTPPKVSVPAFSVDSSEPRAEIFRANLSESYPITVEDNAPGTVKTEVSIYELKGEDSALVGTTDSLEIKFVREGAFRAEIKATDSAGNTTTINSYFNTDGTKPVVILPERRSVYSGEDILIYTQGASHVMTCLSEVNGPSCAQAGRPFVRTGMNELTPWNFKISVHQEGRYVLSIYAVDGVGNKTDVMDFSFTVDSTAPLLTFDGIDKYLGGVKAVSYSHELPRISYTTNEPEAQTSCQTAWLGGHGTCDASGGVIKFDLPDAEMSMTYWVELTLTDAAGNYTKRNMTFVYNKARDFRTICENRQDLSYHTDISLNYILWALEVATCEEAETILSQAQSLRLPPITSFRFDLSTIAQFRSIKKLDVSGVTLLDTAPLAEMDLVHLEIPNTDVLFLSPVAKNANLEKLNVDFMTIADGQALSELRKLKSLGMNFAGINLKNDGIMLPASIEVLGIHSTGTSDLTTIKHLDRLRVLWAFSNGIEDLEPLRDKQELVDLVLSDNKFKLVEPISQLQKLEQLRIDNNLVTDIQALKNPNLRLLNIDASNVGTISALPINLTELSCGLCKMKNLDFLVPGSKVETLDLRANNVWDFAPLKNIAASLKRLDIPSAMTDWNNAPDLTVFSEVVFPKLEYLDLSKSRHDDFTPLKNLPAHVYVDLRGIWGDLTPDKCPTDAGPFSVRQFCTELAAAAPVPVPTPVPAPLPTDTPTPLPTDTPTP